MVAVVDIANRALGLLGDRANIVSISPPEGGAQADHVARFWPMARDTALEANDWAFASTYAAPAEITAPELPGWVHVYTLPIDNLVVREMRFGDGALYGMDDERLPRYDLATLADGTPVLLTDAENPSIRYTRRVVDPTRYSALFVDAVTFLLAGYLAGPVVKGRSGSQAGDAMYQRYLAALSRAAVVDANQANTRPDFQPSNMRARGVARRGSLRGPFTSDTTSFPGV